MAGTLLRVNGTEVLEGSDKTTINVNFCQESSLSYLCKGMVALSRRRAASKAQEPAEAPLTRVRRRGEQKVLGGAQILLGAVCIGLGVVLSLPEIQRGPFYYYDQRNGAPFWMGSLFILSGIFSVVGERRGGKWVHLATFLNLASIVAGSLALVVGVADIPSPTYQPYFIEDLFKHRREELPYRSWEATTRPYNAERDQERAKQCQEVLWALVRPDPPADLVRCCSQHRPLLLRVRPPPPVLLLLGGLAGVRGPGGPRRLSCP